MHFTRQEPQHQTDRRGASVVAWNADVNETERIVRVDKRDDRDVDVRGLGDRLMIGDRVDDQNQTRLLEGTLNLIGERAGRETASNWSSTSVSGILQAGTLTDLTGRNDAHVGGILDGSDGASGQHQLVPHLLDVEQTDASLLLAFEHILFHARVEIGRAQMGVGHQNFGQVIVLKAKHSFCSRHRFLLFWIFLEQRTKIDNIYGFYFNILS